MDKKKIVKELGVGAAVVAGGILYRWKVSNKGSKIMDNVDYTVALCTLGANDALVQEVMNETDSEQKVDKSRVISAGAAAAGIIFSFRNGIKHFAIEAGYNGWRLWQNSTKARLNKLVA